MLVLAVASFVVASTGVMPLGDVEPVMHGDDVVIGVDAILSRIDALAVRPENPRARELVTQGEELLLAFEHARAAAALGEAAALLEPTLSAADFETWTRARTLAGVAWMEAGNADAAQDAFTKLLVLHPDVEPDASLLSPAARATFDAARADVTSRGSGTIEVRTTPSAADAIAVVIVDGRVRGRAPLSVAGLVAGPHRVALVAPGYETNVADVRVERGALVAHDVTLAASRHRRALASLDGDAPASASLAELRAVLVAARLEALLVFDVAKVNGADGFDIVRARRITASDALGVHVRRDPVETLAARLQDAFARRDATADFSTLLGTPAPSTTSTASTPSTSAIPAPTATDDTTWLVVGGVGGVVVLAAAATAVTLALWPQPTPARTLAVAIELPAP